MNPQLLLKNIRNVLVRLEETIMFNLIERGQFKRNTIIYNPDSFATIGEECLVDYLLHETEKIHARVRRYNSPDEHPFYDDLPEAVIPALNYQENPLHPHNININCTIKKQYLHYIIPLICCEGDDQQYGSSAVADVACLQSLSKRIHYGKFVAESKFRQDSQKFTTLIRRNDRAALQEAITDEEVEMQVLQRIRRKASTYLHELTADASSNSVTPEALVTIYREFIIPLTKQVEVEYLLQRLA
ncbi:MAG: chorismate mutase [Lentisphaeria bacterium]